MKMLVDRRYIMHIYKPNCKCPKEKGDSKKGKKCTCGAKWGFMVDVGINPVTGKRKQKFKGGFNTRKEAELAAAAFKIEIANGNTIIEQDTTFEQFAKEWLKWYEGTGKVKESTVRVRNHEVGRLLQYFAKIRMRDITKKQYQDAINELKASGLADNTLEGAHGTGRAIFRRALELDVIRTDPTQFAYVPKLQRTVEELEAAEEPEKYMEKEELLTFLHTAKWKGMERDYIIFMVLAYTGMRVGELCALKWSDIDLEAHTISISKTYYNPKNNIKDYRLLPPKTPSSRRVIGIDQDLVELLQQHKAVQELTRERYKDTYHDKDFVIAKMDKSRGYPEYIKTIENRMRRLLKYAGLDQELTPHSLRHTHVSLLAAAGIPLHEIMDRLGHKDDEVTRHIYLHVTMERKKEAPLRFAEILRDAPR
jgi:integrase